MPWKETCALDERLTASAAKRWKGNWRAFFPSLPCAAKRSGGGGERSLATRAGGGNERDKHRTPSVSPAIALK